MSEFHTKNKIKKGYSNPPKKNFSITPRFNLLKGEVGVGVPKTKVLGGEFTAGASFSPFRKKDKGRVGFNMKWKLN
jgi:hypothetical protein